MKVHEYIASIDIDKALSAGIVPFTVKVHYHVYLRVTALLAIGHRAHIKKVAEEYRLTRRQVLRIVKNMKKEL